MIRAKSMDFNAAARWRERDLEGQRALSAVRRSAKRKSAAATLKGISEIHEENQKLSIVPINNVRCRNPF
jgi:predicted  nucleic acid-binding Zn-ribbon protein